MRVHETTGHDGPRPAAATLGSPPLTLADEHTLLLSRVANRAADLLTTTAGDRWPARDLQALLGYLRAEVLREAADEETILFPAHGASPGIARPVRDHARLRACTDVLARAAAGEVTWFPRRLLRSPEISSPSSSATSPSRRHCWRRPACRPKWPAITALGGHPHGWYQLTRAGDGPAGHRDR